MLVLGFALFISGDLKILILWMVRNDVVCGSFFRAQAASVMVCRLFAAMLLLRAHSALADFR